MANPKQIALLMESVEGWNKWREENFFAKVDLTKANLSRSDLHGANLNRAVLRDADISGADLNGTNLSQAILNGANLSGANLNGAYLDEAILNRVNFSDANLQGAHLFGAHLEKANFYATNLTEANLRGANLINANFQMAVLNKADLSGADLYGVNFTGAILSESCFNCAQFGRTILAETDLSKAKNLEECRHVEPSHITTDTLQLSKGKIPAVFLRGCGLSDWEIEAAKLYAPDLSNQEINEIMYKVFDLRATRAIQISPLFISYSHADSSFIDALEIQLNQKGIRFWRDVHDATSGRLEKQIDRAIRQNPTVLLILSKGSTHSDWVEHEVRTARALEKELGRDALCPIALDDSWKTCPWPKRVMEQVMEYNILDFSAWKDEKTFQKMFVKLIDGLQLFYKK